MVAQKKEGEWYTTTIDWSANVWDIKTSEKVKIFLWNALHAALPVGEQFAIRNISISNRCTRCSDVETVAHLLFTCPYAREVWKLALIATTIDVDQITDTLSGMELIRRVPTLPPVDLGPGTLTAAICWNLWISRNQLTFQKRDFSPKETLLKATIEAREWTLAQISRLIQIWNILASTRIQSQIPTSLACTQCCLERLHGPRRTWLDHRWYMVVFISFSDCKLCKIAPLRGNLGYAISHDLCYR